MQQGNFPFIVFLVFCSAALIGAAAGGIVGSVVGAPGTGALVGVALGGETGALVGDQLLGGSRNSSTAAN
jgi:Glycine zipper